MPKNLPRDAGHTGQGGHGAAGHQPPRAHANYASGRPRTTYSTAGRKAAKAGRPKGKTGLRGLFDKAAYNKTTLLYILLAVVAAVLIVAVLLIVLLPGGGTTPASSGSWPLYASSLNPDSDYDKDENSLPVGQYAGTILAETEDAGDDYVTDTLFIGDSNTERMLAFRDVTGVTMANGIGVTNMGVTMVNSLACVKFKGMAAVTIPQAVKIMQPRRLVITFGTNDASMETKSFIASYRSALESIQTAYPYTDIIIGAVPPITKTHQYPSLSMKKIDAFNLALVELAEEMDLKFLNWTEALKDTKTGYCKASYMLEDGVHLNKAGMEAIFTYFRTHALDTEDSRPKPLADIPVREGTPSGLFPSASSSSQQAVSSSASASQAALVVQAGEGGQVTVGGKTGASFTLKLTPGTVTDALTAVPDKGYTFKGWTCAAVAISEADKTKASLYFTIPAEYKSSENIVIVANFEQIPAGASVTFSSDGNGSVSPGGTQAVAAGGSVQLTATPNSGFEFDRWECSAGSVAVSGNVYTYTVPADIAPGTAVTVKAYFKAAAPAPTTISVTVTADLSGAAGYTASTDGLPMDPGRVVLDPTNGGSITGFTCSVSGLPDGSSVTWYVNGGSVGTFTGAASTLSSIYVPAGTANNASFVITVQVTPPPSGGGDG